MKSLATSPRYRRFMAKRDHALDGLLWNALRDYSVILNQALRQAEAIISHRYREIPPEGFMMPGARSTLDLIDQQISVAFRQAGMRIAQRAYRLRRNVFVLSSAAGHEAIAQGLDKKLTFVLSHFAVDKTQNGKRSEDLVARIQFGLSKLRRKIMTALELSRVLEEPLNDAIERVRRTFPPIKRYRAVPRQLRLLREAGADPKGPLSLADIDDDEWEDMVDAYKKTELPAERFNNEPIRTEDGEPVYQWEEEQAMIHDFVLSVRDGEEEAARQAGIKDFVWIAIVDDKTDECCSRRDGMTSAEIQAKLGALNRGLKDYHQCDAIVPPAHFNCRCRMAPIGDVEDRPESGAQDFEEWLNS